MERRPEISFESYDRFFPNQDSAPAGRFGNLIALPRDGRTRDRGNSVFVDDKLEPYEDQWAFLASLERLTPVPYQHWFAKRGNPVACWASDAS